MTSPILQFDIPPYRLSGTVYGVLLNHRPALEALGESVLNAPYKGAPRAPVLYMKPRNTLSAHGQTVALPAIATAFQVGASLGMVIGRTACKVPPQSALDYVAGYIAVCDLSVPHDSFYRPSLRFKAVDGSCVIGPCVVPRNAVANPDALGVRVLIDGKPAQSTTSSGMLRPAAQLLADVTEFMTLAPGDVLMLGVAHDAPLARAGQHIAVEIEGLARLEAQLGVHAS